MRIKRSIQVGSAILVMLALCVLLYAPAQAAARTDSQTAAYRVSPTSISANVYLTGQMLQPLFQSNINQAIPQMVGNALASMVSQLPKQDQGWASQMANALLQPSAQLLSLKPQANGLLATLRLSLYPGDPKAIATTLLVGFKVVNASTIQVTALPAANGGQSLVSGPLTTFTIPIGTLKSIVATPNCGDANLSINLKFPVSLGKSSQATGQTTTRIPTTTALAYTQPADPALNSYIEIPVASLAQLGSSIGSMQVSSSITAKNIRVGVQGSNLVVTSDIYWLGLNVGVAVSTMLPGAASGSLVVQVLKTNLQIFGGLISFPINSYNQQIQHTLNAELTGALTGTFKVSQATIGFNPHVSCAAANSLILAGTIALG